MYFIPYVAPSGCIERFPKSDRASFNIILISALSATSRAATRAYFEAGSNKATLGEHLFVAGTFVEKRAFPFANFTGYTRASTSVSRRQRTTEDESKKKKGNEKRRGKERDE